MFQSGALYVMIIFLDENSFDSLTKKGQIIVNKEDLSVINSV